MVCVCNLLLEWWVHPLIMLMCATHMDDARFLVKIFSTTKTFAKHSLSTHDCPEILFHNCDIALVMGILQQYLCRGVWRCFKCNEPPRSPQHRGFSRACK